MAGAVAACGVELLGGGGGVFGSVEVLGHLGGRCGGGINAGILGKRHLP